MENKEQEEDGQQEHYTTTTIQLPLQSPPQITSKEVKKLIRTNPAILSLFFGVGTHAFLNQFFKLFPRVKPEYLPYLSTPPALALAIAGFGMGANFVKNPLYDISSHTGQRIAIASLEALGVIFPSILATASKVYCDIHPDCRKVSDSDFAAEILPAALAVALYYGIWYSISPTRRKIWCIGDSSKLTKSLTYITDATTKTLLYSRILQSLMTNIKPIPESWIYEYVSVPAASLVLAGQVLRHEGWWQKIETFMLYVICGNLAVYMGNFLKEESQSPDDLWSFYLKALLFPALLVTGAFFTIKYFQQHSATAASVPLRPSVVPNKNSLPFSTTVQFAEALSDPQQGPQIISQLLSNSKVIEQLTSNPQIVAQLKNVTQQEEDIELMRDKVKSLTLEEIQENPMYKPIAERLFTLLGLEYSEAPLLPNLLEHTSGAPLLFQQPPSYGTGSSSTATPSTLDPTKRNHSNSFL